MLKGVDYCLGHPLYRAESHGLVEPLEFAEPYRYWRLCLRSFAV